MRNTPRPTWGLLLRLQTCSRTALLRRKGARTDLEKRLRESRIRYRLPILGYVVLPDTVGILALPDSLATVGRFVGHLCGGAACAYSRKSQREGPFWRKRAHYTLVEGTALRRCLEMLVWEPVRQEMALHPCDYRWNGYRELIGLRLRYRVLDPVHLSRLYGEGDNLGGRIADSIEVEQGRAKLEDWSRALAVGDKEWMERAAAHLPRHRRNIAPLDLSSGSDLQAIVVANQARRYCLRRLVLASGGMKC